ncbi:T9SS type B sorting domain-containing protein [Flavobacterium pedocola]
MTKVFNLFWLLFLLNATLLNAQEGASSCAELEANYQLYQSCATNIPFQNSTGANNESFTSTCIPQPFRGPTWFFMEIKTSGDIILQISQVNNGGSGTDVDFILWGPFNNLNNICNQLNPTTEVDCSWAPDSVETVTLPNAVTGQLYVLLIDNYSNQPGSITITQTGGTGSSNCDFLSAVDILNNTLNEITQIDYCKPETKDIVARIDVRDFPGLPSNLRFNYKWYKDNTLINTITNSTSSTNTLTVSESGVYKVETTAYDSTDPTVIIANLRVSTDEITLKFHTTPQVNVSHTNSVCLNTNPVLQANITNQASLNTTTDVLAYQWYQDNNPIPSATGQNYTPTEPGDYFVRVSNAPCNFADSNVTRIYIYPVDNISGLPYIVCVNKNNTPVTAAVIDTQLSSDDFDFVWFNGFNAITGSEIPGETSTLFQTDIPGNYSVKITNKVNPAACSRTLNFTVNNSYIPDSINGQPDELIAFELENTITAIATPASPDYLYSIDNGDWQTSNVFTNVAGGEHTITVSNKYNCGALSANIIVVDYPKFFTPNGDNYNDTWKIGGVKALDSIEIYIFDRYGKLVKQLNPNGEGWNGTFNGKMLPSSDYWFRLKYKKNGLEKEFSGHFSLKR